MQDVKNSKKITLNVPEAARELGLGLNSTYALLRSGRLGHIRVGKRILIPAREIEAFLERELRS